MIIAVVAEEEAASGGETLPQHRAEVVVGVQGSPRHRLCRSLSPQNPQIWLFLVLHWVSLTSLSHARSNLSLQTLVSVLHYLVTPRPQLLLGQARKEEMIKKKRGQNNGQVKKVVCLEVLQFLL